MRIIVYSETSGQSVGSRLGKADYSYFFILEKYLPVLERLGEVVRVRDPESEVDELYDSAIKHGQTAVFLSFTPPHNTQIGLRCPTICVLAWEFESIPDESWDPDRPYDNWVDAINAIGSVITISEFATAVIRGQVSEHVRLATIPAPVVSGQDIAEHVASISSTSSRSGYARTKRPMQLSASVVDSWQYDIDPEAATPRIGIVQGESASQPLWDGHAVEWNFTSSGGDSGQYLVGFYNVEEWGVWTRSASPSIILPWLLQGDFELSLELVGYDDNRGRTLRVAVGDQESEATIPSSLDLCTFRFSLDQPANSIRLSGIEAIALPGARDHRTLGIGVSRLLINRPEAKDGDSPANHDDSIVPKGMTELALEGIVYTSVFNPVDGRKNWHDIVTAFGWAFRDDPQKTLVLKMSHHNIATFLGELLLLFSRLSPFECRIVAIHGFLDVREFDNLIANTDYFVNASTAEGQCLPLLEFMAKGVPAVAPRHTAMLSYLSEDNAFIVDSSRQPSIWPNDPRRVYRTFSNRIDWDSLCRQFQRSASVLSNEPGEYTSMSAAASSVVQSVYSESCIARELEVFLKKVARQ